MSDFVNALKRIATFKKYICNMKNLVLLTFLIILIASCKHKEIPSVESKLDWSSRTITLLPDSMTIGTTYLPIYSEVYHLREDRTHDLTATISMRNPNRADSIYIESAKYFNTQGKEVRTYFDQYIYIAPMETVQIVIEEKDKEGGAGASFLFNWSVKPDLNEPIFEGVMISTSGQQGLSFKTKGIRVD